MIKAVFKYTCIFSIGLLFLTSCTQDTTGKRIGNELWEMEASILANGKSIDRKPYNEGIEKAMAVRLPWVYSPLTIALKVAGQQMISPQVNMVSKSLSGNELVTEVAVIIEKNNLLDDSVKDEYFWIRLKLGGSIWQVEEIKHAWRCRENRGHQELSAVNCD